MIAFALLGVVNRGLGQEPAAAPIESCHSKIEHLLKAAEHLEAAGLTDDAYKVRKEAANVPAWQAEIDRRRALGIPTPPVLLKIRVIEISRTKLQELGFSFDRVCSAPRGFNGDAHMVPSNSTYSAYSTPDLLKVLDALREDHLAKVLAEPSLATMNNRPVSFHAGGQSRVAVPQGKGRVSVEDKPYGTLVDFLPVVLDDQTIHLTCRIEVSQLDLANTVTVAGETVPALNVLRADTSGDFRSGQTVVLGGPRQLRHVSSPPATSDSSARAAPKADDKPKAKEVVEEIETLVLLTPYIIEPMLSDKAVKTQTRR